MVRSSSTPGSEYQLLGRFFFVTPVSRSGPQPSLSLGTRVAVSWSPRARPSGTSPGDDRRIKAIRLAPGSGREPNGPLLEKSSDASRAGRPNPTRFLARVPLSLPFSGCGVRWMIWASSRGFRTAMPDSLFFKRLKERKLVQWAFAYFAGAFVVFQLLDALAEPLRLTPTIQRVVLVIVGIGFFFTLVIAWYHGEKGRQRVSGPELLMVASLLVIAGVALTLLGSGKEGGGPLPLESDDRPAIAVFPCENWSPDPADAYFASGIHDEILLQLQKISGLRSVGRESMEWYEANPQPLRAIALDLAVGFLGECSVLKDVERNQVRLTFQLLDGRTGSQIWAENYYEDLSARSIFDIHSDVARSVAQAVGAVITPEEEIRIDVRPTESSAAYDQYLIGRSWLRQRTEESFLQALRHFENAAGADSTFALAYVGMADSYALLGSYQYLPSREAFSSAREFAVRALEFDRELGEAHASLGYVQFRFDWDFESSLRSYQRALELAPNYAQVYQWYAVALSSVGRGEEGIQLIETALSLDPLNFNHRRAFGSIHSSSRDYAQAVDQLEQALAINPGFHPTEADLGIALILKGDHGEGLRHLENSAQLAADNPGYQLLLAWAYAKVGQIAKARGILREVGEAPYERPVDPVGLAMVFAELGELASALDWLERGLQIRSPRLLGARNSEVWDPLRSDPRFEDLLERFSPLPG